VRQVRVSGPLSFNVSFTLPSDLGLGLGMDYPLLGFQVVYADTSGPPVLARSGTRLQYVTADDNGDVRLWTLLEVGLEVGVVYHVAVRLQNANNADLEGFGPWSTTATTVCVDGLSRPTVCPGPGITALSFPSPPPALGIRPKGNRTLLFEWLRSADTGSGDSQYPLVAVEIELEEESGANSLLLAAPGEAFEFISPPLRPGIFYRARARSVNDAGSSVWTAFNVSIALWLPSPPGQPRVRAEGAFSLRAIFAPSGQTGVGGTEWPLLGYHLEAFALPSYPGCEGGVNLSLSSGVLPSDVLTTLAEGLLEGCSYRCRVRAENVAGFSLWSAPAIRMALSLPQAPRELSAETLVALRVALAWKIPENSGDGRERTAAIVQAYDVEVSLSGDFSPPLLRAISAPPGIGSEDLVLFDINLLEQVSSSFHLT
jgi:hypothetical protein